MMTVGELAKKSNVSVRTLQYYDKEGLLKPSELSEGGRRLYNNKDMAILHQILTLKSLGFSLTDIKNNLIPADNVKDVADILDKQREIINEQISKLNESLGAIEFLRKEIAETNKVNWVKYADMLYLIKNNNENVWLYRHLDDDVIDNIRTTFDEKTGYESFNNWKKLCIKAAELCDKGLETNSPESQQLAKEWWDMVMNFTGGDVNMLSKLVDFHDGMGGWPEELRDLQQKADPFLHSALELYLANLYNNRDPFKEGGQ